MQNTSASTGRLYFLDWLRVLSMICIFFFHNARFYDVFGDWHVKNATTNTAASAVIAIMSPWIMPLFFLIAGAGTYLAFKSRNAGQYLGERTLRLFIPFIFGMLVIVVPQAYFQAVFQGTDLSGYNLIQIYGLYLQSLPELNTFHLWFLLDLFLFSIIALPLFLSPKGGTSLLSKIARAFHQPWLLLLLVILSIALVNTFLYPDGFFGNRGSGGWNIVTYILFFLFGYLIFADVRIIEWIKKFRWYTLISAVVISTLLFVLFLDVLVDPAAYYGSMSFFLAHLFQSISTWSWLLTFLGLAGQYLTKTNRFLTYSNEAVLPFYILHQTVIISIGFFVVQWSSGVGLKYLVISTTSFIVIMAIYELLVRRINILRFLFGMRWKRSQRVVTVREGPP